MFSTNLTCCQLLTIKLKKKHMNEEAITSNERSSGSQLKNEAIRMTKRGRDGSRSPNVRGNVSPNVRGSVSPGRGTNPGQLINQHAIL